MNPLWFVRIPFAITFSGHGAGKLLMPVASAQMLDMSVALSLLVGIAAVPVLLGAIFLVHWPRWSFVASESHPFGGMEFQVLLLGVALVLYAEGHRPGSA